MIRNTSWKSWEKYLENMQSNNDNEIDVTDDNINVDFIDHTESFLNEQLSWDLFQFTWDWTLELIDMMTDDW